MKKLLLLFLGFTCQFSFSQNTVTYTDITEEIAAKKIDDGLDYNKVEILPNKFISLNDTLVMGYKDGINSNCNNYEFIKAGKKGAGIIKYIPLSGKDHSDEIIYHTPGRKVIVEEINIKYNKRPKKEEDYIDVAFLLKEINGKEFRTWSYIRAYRKAFLINEVISTKHGRIESNLSSYEIDERLEKLNQLKEDQAISNEMYEAKAAELNK
ncbi:hypothetical protein LX95_01274 [Mesonia algae]|uniref:Uncharacterized protein n=1 Tax=Mesonia algae TaxID=213248 RepID=A0A2W7ISF7_9FLAO|nr:hypothetical protein [Mesonia algae]PZW41593.1 hypothetical protein LX95_01274 [Mesonia algae]